MDQTIETANAVLEDRLSTLQRETDAGKLQDAAADIHRIIYGAITQHPTEVNAVQIPLLIDTQRDDSVFPDSGVWYCGRHPLDHFLKSGGGETFPASYDFTFTKHLPYTFDREPMGHRVRGMGPHVKNIEVIAGKHDYPKAFFEIELGEDIDIIGSKARLFPDEVRGLKLVMVDNSEFTPFATEHLERSFALEKSLEAENHYARFRGFTRYFIQEKNFPDMPLKSDTMERVKSVEVPNYTSQGLFDKIFSSNGSFSGFAIDGSGGQPILFEITGFQIPRELQIGYFFGKDAVLAAYAINHFWANQSPNVTIYTGREIVNRLAQIPAIRKNFG